MADPTTPVALAADFPAADHAQWRGLIDKALKGADFDRRLVARTADGIRIEPLFTSRPAVSNDIEQPSSSADGLAWDIRQLHAGTDAAAVNAAILADLAGGASSITLQFAAPGQTGLASGAAEIARALDGVLLDVCPIALRAGENTAAAAAGLTALWAARGLAPAQQRGAFNYDPLGTLAATGALAYPLDATMRNAAALVKQTLPLPGVTALAAHGPVWHTAGASEGQELAAVLATVVAYLRAAEAAGVAPVQALPKIAVTLAIDADQLMGLAKLRAARLLFARVAEACGAPEAAQAMILAAETSTPMMTRRDPWVNMLRTTMACATAAMGGAQAITVLPYTWALGQSDAFAQRMARNTSIVLMEESALGRVADPAAGSFAVETLTADLAKIAWAQFQKIEAAGGLAAILSTGALQAEIAATAAAKVKDIATGKVALTGTSAFPRLGDDGVKVVPWPTLPPDAPPKGHRAAPLAAFRPSAPFERLRDAADAHTAKSGAPPRVFLVCLGPLAAHAARATWTSNFLAAGGIESVQSPPLLQSQDAGEAFRASGASVVCLCGADENYAELGEATASLLKTVGAQTLYVAGRPKDQDVALNAAGVEGFLYAGCDMIATLAAVQQALGVAGGNA